MWLDRLAAGAAPSTGSSTPQPASRPYSPAPRRTSSNLSPYVISQRPGHSPRASSLSLVSNDSSTSLLTGNRRPNGSGLRQISNVDQPPEPTVLLDRLLDVKKDTTSSIQHVLGFVTDADLALQADFDGLSLKALAASEDDASKDESRSSMAAQNVEDHDLGHDKFEELHKSIAACDDVLNSVEINLASFRNDLATVSSDIESLQDRSTALNRRLENRQKVEKALGPLVEELSVSPETISKITTGQVDESWAKMLLEVDRRATAYSKRTSDVGAVKAASDMGPLLEKLVLKAVERIRDFLVAQIKALRSPHINAQVIQQQQFLRFKELYTFLHKHHTQLADEIALAYMNTMRWYYLNRFGRYEKALGKVKLHVLDRNDLLGHEDTSRKTSVLSGPRASATPHDAFNLGRRIDILRTTKQTALPSHLAEEDVSTHYFEIPFRNFNLALIDNATAEYTFLATFFSPSVSFARISKTFNYIFEPTFDLGQALSRTLVTESHDALGLLLSIRLNQHFAFELQRRKVPAVDGYVNGTNMLLWPRLQVIVDRHCESVKQLTNALPTKPPNRSAAELAKLSTAPHMVTQRFGQLLQGLLALSSEGGDDEPVITSLRRLRSEVEAFLTKQSQMFGSDKRKSQRFLYNNYSLISTIIGDTTGKLAEEHQSHYEKLKDRYQEKS